MISIAGFPSLIQMALCLFKLLPVSDLHGFLSKNFRTLAFVTEAGNASKGKQCCRKRHVIIQSRTEI